MPTPFMHLHMVEKILKHPKAKEIRPLLNNHLPAFSFGNIAPDFQAICEVEREASHFYPIPPEKNDYEAFGRLLQAHPTLQRPNELTKDEAIFTAGYGAHLLFDLIWDHTILTPNFRNSNWAEPLVRFLAHNIMLTYLDREARTHIPSHVAQTLSHAPISTALSFASAEQLDTWRRTIADQLQPNTPSRTVEIYAQRMRMTTEQFIDHLDDTQWMHEHVFEQVSWQLVHETLDDAVPQAIALLNDYLRPIL